MKDFFAKWAAKEQELTTLFKSNGYDFPRFKKVLVLGFIGILVVVVGIFGTFMGNAPLIAFAGCLFAGLLVAALWAAIAFTLAKDPEDKS